MTRRGIRTLAALAVAVLATFGLTQPASAGTSWDPITWTGYTPCSLTYHIVDNVNVQYQACTVVSGHYMQVVAVITNHSGENVHISAPYVDSYIDETSTVHDECVPSQLGPGSRRGCFGTTRYIPCGSAIDGWVVVFIENVAYYPPPPLHSPC